MSPKRQAGQRLRVAAKTRRREVAKKLWKQLLVATIAWLAITGITVALVAIFNTHFAAFALGAFSALYLAFGYVVFRFLDYRGAQLSAGAEAESSTAEQLRKLRRHGWHAVHNIHLHGDIDHVAIGPGGVFAIETKSSTTDWQFVERVGKPRQWAAQARRNASRAGYLIKQESGHAIEVRPLIVAWVPEQPDESRTVDGNVVCVRGLALEAYLRSLPQVLETEIVVAIADGLETAATKFDDYLGVTYPGLLKRLLGLQS
jgi:hypothetical protein